MMDFETVSFDETPSFDVEIPEDALKSTEQITLPVIKKKKSKSKQPDQQPPLKKKRQDESNNESVTTTPNSSLLSQMSRKIDGARFRQINELLYTTTSQKSAEMFIEAPDLGSLYHKGYVEQVSSWPVNPVDVIISRINTLPTTTIVADLGCGDAKIARSVKCTIHSFDIHPVHDFVIRCDISNVPLSDKSVDVVVFCLSLMGTNYIDFIKEASRILKPNGTLLIAEVSSRFEDLGHFNSGMRAIGFNSRQKDSSNSHFILLEYRKAKDFDMKNIQKAKSMIKLGPCIYKRR
ncbi:hypothetical protein RCL1_008438 [Eukaryota sp. TZLM3-RCL]